MFETDVPSLRTMIVGVCPPKDMIAGDQELRCWMWCLGVRKVRVSMRLFGFVATISNFRLPLTKFVASRVKFRAPTISSHKSWA